MYKTEKITTFPGFEIVYLLEITYHYIAIVVFVGLDILFIILILDLYLHLQFLKYHLKNLGLDKIQTDEDSNVSYKKIEKCVLYHIQLIRYYVFIVLRE